MLPNVPVPSTLRPFPETSVARSRRQRSSPPPRRTTTRSGPTCSTRWSSPTSGWRAPSRPATARAASRWTTSSRSPAPRSCAPSTASTSRSPATSWPSPCRASAGRCAATSATTAGWCALPVASRSSSRRSSTPATGCAPRAAVPCTEQAIAEALDVPVEDVVEALRAEGCFSPRSLDVPLTDGGSTLVGDAISDPRGGEHLAAAEARVMLRPLVRRSVRPGPLPAPDEVLRRAHPAGDRRGAGRHADPGLPDADPGAGRPARLPLGVTDRAAVSLDA